MSAFGPQQTFQLSRRMSAFGVKRTLAKRLVMSANDPRRTLAGEEAVAALSLLKRFSMYSARCVMAIEAAFDR
jgi:hypothetical protein